MTFLRSNVISNRCNVSFYLILCSIKADSQCQGRQPSGRTGASRRGPKRAADVLTFARLRSLVGVPLQCLDETSLVSQCRAKRLPRCEPCFQPTKPPVRAGAAEIAKHTRFRVAAGVPGPPDQPSIESSAPALSLLSAQVSG